MPTPGSDAMICPNFRSLLAFSSRNSPLILVTGVLIGLVAPSLVDMAQPLLGFAVFVFTLAVFLKINLPFFRQELQQPVLTAYRRP